MRERGGKRERKERRRQGARHLEGKVGLELKLKAAGDDVIQRYGTVVDLHDEGAEKEPRGGSGEGEGQAVVQAQSDTVINNREIKVGQKCVCVRVCVCVCMCAPVSGLCHGSVGPQPRTRDKRLVTPTTTRLSRSPPINSA